LLKDFVTFEVEVWKVTLRIMMSKREREDNLLLNFQTTFLTKNFPTWNHGGIVVSITLLYIFLDVIIS
jgi:hypothetical protein